jgi:hypothetical protein
VNYRFVLDRQRFVDLDEQYPKFVTADRVYAKLREVMPKEDAAALIKQLENNPIPNYKINKRLEAANPVDLANLTYIGSEKFCFSGILKTPAATLRILMLQMTLLDALEIMQKLVEDYRKTL